MKAWRSLSRPTRAVVVALAAVVAANLFFSGLRQVTGGEPGGPTSSSYATGDDGLAAFASLLRQHGHEVSRLREPVHETAQLDAGATLVVADPADMSATEADAVARFVRQGGRLVAAGPRAGPALRRLLGADLAWSARGAQTAGVVAPTPETAVIDAVRASERGSWRDTAAGLPVLADDGTVLALVADVERGRVVALADAAVLQNAWLDEADNAAFGLAAVGGRTRPVWFAEEAHGFGPASGLPALPSRWKWALLLGAVSGLAWMWSKGRRFGPPDEVERELSPPRRAYVEAVAASLSKVKRPNSAVAPLQEAARLRVARRVGLAPDASPAELRAAGRRLGLPDDEIDALTRVPTRDEDVLAAGRALARLEGTRW